MDRLPPEEIRDLAAACVRYVQQALSIELDFTPDTLPLLDHYLQEANDPSNPELLALIAPSAGAYFGIVVDRALGPAHWHTAGQEYGDYRLQFERCFLHFNPMGQALEAIYGKSVDGWGANLSLRAEDTRAVKAALERLGDVRSDDYYRLSTRLEVLEQVVATLVGQAIARGELEHTYGAEDYATAIAEAQAAEEQGGRPN